MNGQGWFAMKRGTLEHEMFAPEGKWSRFEAWAWMIETAAYKPTTIDLSGAPHVVPRGALCFSLRFLADKFRWTVKAVRGFLSKLERHGAISIQTVQVGNKRGTARTQLTLCNYEKYQSAGHSKGTAGAQQGHKEEQGNNTSYEVAAATPPIEQSDVSFLSKAVWEMGKPYLAGQGVKNPGAVIGKWLKDHQPADVLAALEAARKAGTQEPVPYITKVLSGQGAKVSRFPSKFDAPKKPHWQVMEEREQMERRLAEMRGTGT